MVAASGGVEKIFWGGTGKEDVGGRGLSWLALSESSIFFAISVRGVWALDWIHGLSLGGHSGLASVVYSASLMVEGVSVRYGLRQNHAMSKLIVCLFCGGGPAHGTGF